VGVTEQCRPIPQTGPRQQQFQRAAQPEALAQHKSQGPLGGKQKKNGQQNPAAGQKAQAGHKPGQKFAHIWFQMFVHTTTHCCVNTLITTEFSQISQEFVVIGADSRIKNFILRKFYPCLSVFIRVHPWLFSHQDCTTGMQFSVDSQWAVVYFLLGLLPIVSRGACDFFGQLAVDPGTLSFLVALSSGWSPLFKYTSFKRLWHLYD
jgi:hypothetical protein